MKTSRRPLRQVRRALLVASAFSICIGTLMLAVPVFALQLLEAAVPAGSLELVAVLAGLVALALIVAGVLDYCRELMLLRAGLWLDHTLGAEQLENGLEAGSGAEALRARAHDIRTLKSALVGGPLGAALDLPWAVAACALVYLLHPMLALACAAALVAMLLCLLAFHFASAGNADADAPAQDEAQRWLEDVARQARCVAADGLAVNAGRQWELANRRRVGEGYIMGRRHGLARAAARTLRAAGLAGLLGAGGYLVVTDGLLPGAVVAAVLVAARALAGLEQAVAGWDRILAAQRSWRTLAAAGPTAVEGAASVPSAANTGRIDLQGMSCCYPGNRQLALEEVALSIAPGECIGIVGPQGSGKSALAAAIAGVLQPTSGRADLDGAPIATSQRTSERRAIGYMADEPRLLAGSVLDNISGFAPGAETTAMRAAIRAGVHEALARLPQGYETIVGEDGAALSMRTRRAIALARALNGNPRLVVLDEPELGLDEAGLGRLAATLEALRRDGTGLVLATREPRLLRLTDRIVLLSGGRVEGVLPSQQVIGMGSRQTAAGPARQVA